LNEKMKCLFKNINQSIINQKWSMFSIYLNGRSHFALWGEGLNPLWS